MKPHAGARPDGREDVLANGSYRSIYRLGPRTSKHPSPAWREVIKETFDMTDEDFRSRHADGERPVEIDHEIKLSDPQIDAFVEMVGRGNVATDDYSRVRFSRGMSLDENLDLRKGVVSFVPDLVLHPRDKEDVKKIVAYCHAEGIAITTFGGGSGVVLGIRADRGGVAVVLRTHMNKMLGINELNKTCRVQPGMLGSDYERALNDAPKQFGTKIAYTGGHFPQSFELASVGGWIAALGSGQASSYYGDAYDLVLGQEYVTPAGVISTSDIPGTATGPKVNDILKGSEGAYGILVEASMKIFKYVPENRQRFAFMFPTWEDAVDTSREVIQGEFGAPAVFRISDPEETEIGLKLKGYGDGAVDRFLKIRGYEPMRRCLCIGTAEGEKSFAKNVKKQVTAIARAHGAMSLTGYATKQWEKGRFSDIHIRDDLLDYGIVIDTLETGVTWDNFHRVRQGVRSFVESRPGTLCLTHASHFYPQGTSLYFIFIMRPEDDREFGEFRASIVSKVVEHGGSISHHHGVGRLFAPWVKTFLGPEELDVLRALKRHFDPKGIMNPGGVLDLDTTDTASR